MFIYSVLHTERSPTQLRCSPGTPAARSLCGAVTEDSVTNGNYICVFFMNPSNTGLLKMLPRYLRLSATSSWDQIGMLLRQSRTTHPLVSLVMCVTACVGEYHVLFNYKCTLSTVVDVQEIGRLQVQFEVWVHVCVQLSLPKHGILMQPVRLCASRYLGTPSPCRQACGTARMIFEKKIKNLLRSSDRNLEPVVFPYFSSWEWKIPGKTHGKSKNLRCSG